jgi:transcriptional regulator with XRE-family HTH domain
MTKRKSIDDLVMERLRARRIRLGIDQKTLSKALGVCYQQLSKYERGENRWPVSTLALACRAMDMDVAEVLAEAGERPARMMSRGAVMEMSRVYALLSPRHQEVIRDVARKLV